MTQPNAANESIIEWLTQWAAAIRTNDLPKGRALFSKDASGFGTVTFMTDSLDDLVERQWTDVWRKTEGFDFDWNLLHIRLSPDEMLAVVHSPWSSSGTNESGQIRQRNGRATIILTRTSRKAAWKCVHTHFSLWPDGADLHLTR